VAKQMMLTGEDLSPQRALELGLVAELTEPGATVAAAVELALRVARSAPTSVAEILRATTELAADDEARGWAATAAAIQVILASGDFQEGIAAFFEKRPPIWPGR
jgi:enoyl-CoA hydratase